MAPCDEVCAYTFGSFTFAPFQVNAMPRVVAWYGKFVFCAYEHNFTRWYVHVVWHLWLDMHVHNINGKPMYSLLGRLVQPRTKLIKPHRRHESTTRTRIGKCPSKQKVIGEGQAGRFIFYFWIRLINITVPIHWHCMDLVLLCNVQWTHCWSSKNMCLVLTSPKTCFLAPAYPPSTRVHSNTNSSQRNQLGESSQARIMSCKASTHENIGKA